MRAGERHLGLLQIGNQLGDLIGTERMVDLDRVSAGHHDQNVFKFFLQNIRVLLTGQQPHRFPENLRMIVIF